MNNRKCIHPRKVIKIMREFIDDISNFEYQETIIKFNNDKPFDEMTTEEFLEAFYNAEEKTSFYKRKCKIINLTGTDKSCCAYSYDLDEDERQYFRIGVNLDEFCVKSKGHLQFTSNFISRCPSARGFAGITLSLLHELGHFETHFIEFEGYNRLIELALLREQYPKEIINFAYFELPDEQAATDWAIKWLNNKENRKKAKSFEKAFFSCFERAV